jgi:tripartite-type tricarboxylate transporter receptor subunit TctC
VFVPVAPAMLLAAVASSVPLPMMRRPSTRPPAAMPTRRRLLLAAPVLALPFAGARAQTGPAWPTRPIRLVVGFPPGGGIDFAARTIQPPLEAALGQPVVVDNKPGVGGMLAAGELARAPADGHTLLLANTGPFAIAPYLQAKMPYEPLRQFTYVGQITEGSYIAVTRPDHPAKDLKQFVEWAKANPQKANYASAGNGSSTHVNGELLSAVTGVELLHIPYKGSAPAVQDLIGGQTQLLIDAGTVVLPQVKAGRLKALAVTGTARDPQLPDVPTVRELGLGGMESVGFQGLVAPAGLPAPIRDRLAAELKKILATPDVRARFAAAGSEVHARGPEEFAAFVRQENEKWSALVKKRGIKAD